MGPRLFRSPLVAAVLFYGALCAPAFALALEISAGLDRNRISLNDQVTLTITLSGGGNLPNPQIPVLADFQIANAGRMQNFTWINGQASASVTHTFILTPLREGSFTIPPIRASAEGQTFETPPLTLTVERGDAAAIAAPEGKSDPAAPRNAGRRGPAAIFIKGSVDKTSVFVGEPVIFTFRLYNRVPLFSRPNYRPPETNGFWSEDLPPQRNYQAVVEGLPYNVTELRTALFPSSAGSLRIGSAELAVTIENLGSDPFSQDFFASFFGRAEEKRLVTEPLSLQVKPLPDPKPQGFKGAVGQFTISSALDKQAVSVGQAVTLTVTVRGAGNIKALPKLEFPPLPNFRMFDANAAPSIEKKDGRVQGSMVYKIVLIPTASGEQRIPAIPFVFFNPERRAYEKLETRPFTLRVTPGGDANAPTQSTGASAPSAADASRLSASQIQRLSEDIRYIKSPESIPSQGRPWPTTVVYWVIQLLGLGAVVGLAGWRFYQTVFLAANPWNRFKHAGERALKAAGQVEAMAERSELKEAATSLSDAFQRYLADKLTLPVSGLARKQVLDAMRQKGLVEHRQLKVRNLWETLDLFEFAPTQIRTEDIRSALATFRHIVEEMEKELTWRP